MVVCCPSARSFVKRLLVFGSYQLPLLLIVRIAHRIFCCSGVPELLILLALFNQRHHVLLLGLIISLVYLWYSELLGTFPIPYRLVAIRLRFPEIRLPSALPLLLFSLLNFLGFYKNIISKFCPEDYLKHKTRLFPISLKIKYGHGIPLLHEGLTVEKNWVLWLTSQNGLFLNLICFCFLPLLLLEENCHFSRHGMLCRFVIKYDLELNFIDLIKLYFEIKIF